jgi:hypothetical protein
MKAVVLLLVFFVSCQDNIHYHYNTRVVEDYSEHFRTLDSIEGAEERAIYLMDSIAEGKNDSIYRL